MAHPANSVGVLGPHIGQGLTAADWKPLEKNTLKGFVTIILPSGVRIRDCAVHTRDGKCWISMPSKAWTKTDGGTTYVPLVDFSSNQAPDRFQELALAAVNRLLGSER
ncbi:MAG: hypothetical protein ACJ746_13540 [Bryobacteraceae bacterium]